MRFRELIAVENMLDSVCYAENIMKNAGLEESRMERRFMLQARIHLRTMRNWLNVRFKRDFLA